MHLTIVSFESAPALDIVVWRVIYKFDGATYYTPATHIMKMIDWLRRAYPTHKINFYMRDLNWGAFKRKWVEDPDTGKGSWQATSPTCSQLNLVLQSQWNFDRITGKISKSTRYARTLCHRPAWRGRRRARALSVHPGRDARRAAAATVRRT